MHKCIPTSEMCTSFYEQTVDEKGNQNGEKSYLSSLVGKAMWTLYFYVKA